MKIGFVIAMAQVEPSPDAPANLEKARAIADKAAAREADLLVFPEMVMGLPAPERPPARIAAEHGGAFAEGLAAVARQSGIAVAAGCWEEGPRTGRAYNVARIFSREGKEVAAYRKIHLFDALSVRESDTMASGNLLPPVVELAGVRVGVAICYDLRFPELFRYLALQGAQVIVVPSAWYQGPVKEVHWTILLQARAIENQMFVIGCNRSRMRKGPVFGFSQAVDPHGRVLAEAGTSEAMLIVDVDEAMVREARQDFPVFRNRRKDVYSFKTED